MELIRLTRFRFRGNVSCDRSFSRLRSVLLYEVENLSKDCNRKIYMKKEINQKQNLDLGRQCR